MDICDKQKRFDGEKNCLMIMIESAVFILFLESLPKIGSDTIRTGYLF